MRTSSALLLFQCCLSASVSGQGTILTEDFESGALGPGWQWTGSTPVMVSPGYLSNWCVSKESADLSDPPFAEPDQIAVLFHELPYDPLVYYHATAMLYMDDPMSTGAVGYIHLGWIDPLDPTVDGMCFGQSSILAPQWFDASASAYYDCTDLIGSNAHFGIAFGMHAGVQNVHLRIDGISVTSEPVSTAMDGPHLAEALCLPNPVLDRVQVSFSQGERPSSLVLYNGQGQRLAAWPTLGAGVLDLDLVEFPQGVYLLHLIGAHGTRVQRLVKT